MRKTYAGRMNRNYAAVRLLEHGPLTFRAFCEITCWPVAVACTVLYRVMQLGRVAVINLEGRRHYALNPSAGPCGAWAQPVPKAV